MRRAIASILLALFSLPLIAPVLFADSVSDLPACCRRFGKHHCSTRGSGSPGGPVARAIQPKCPLFPNGSGVPAGSRTLLSKVQVTGELPVFGLAIPPATHSRPHVLLADSARKRGPPANL